MDKVLILGGTGFVGRSLCELLIGHAGGRCRITVPSRQPTKAKHLQALATVRLVTADVHDPTQLAQLVEGHDAVAARCGEDLGQPLTDSERLTCLQPREVRKLG